MDGLREESADAAADGSRVYGRYREHDQWLKTFADCGFHLICYSADPASMTTLYTVRPIPDEPNDPAFVDFDDVENFSWIEPLQVLLFFRRPPLFSRVPTVYGHATETRQ